MGLYQSFQQVFVTNSPALLAEGKTVDSLAVGQVGILDAKTYKAVTAPTYAKNKALKVVWGTPDINLGDFGGAPNENEYSKLIKGKSITKIRAKKAKRGQTPLYTVGWSGDVSDNDTLSAKLGESKNLFIKLSGSVISRLYDKQGIVKQFVTTPKCTTNCDDACGSEDIADLAKQLADAINGDKDFRKFIRAKVILENAPSVSTSTCYKFGLDVCDTGDDAALGIVQASYPNETISRTGRVGSISTYTVTKDSNSAPADFENTIVLVPNCATCPDGYTLTAEAKVVHVRTATTVTSGNVQSAFTGEVTVNLLNSDPSFKTYVVTFATTKTDSAILSEAATAGYVANIVGVQSGICTQDEPVTTSWAASGTLLRQEKTYRITLADSVCGTNRLTDLQAAYPDLVISVVDSEGSCVHTYETTINSECYEEGCAIENIVWNKPAIFEGAEWKEVAVDNSTVTKSGLLIETGFVNRKTTECTFNSFPYENDIVHVQISNYNPDYNASPCEDEWVVKQIRQVEFPQGHGQYVQHLEKESKQYDQRFRNWDAVVREVQGYSLQADANKYYDQYVVEYFVKGKVAGWAEEYSQAHHLNIFVPEGTGAQLEAALSSYATSAGIEEDGIAI